jgi:hypothetical protein
VIARCRPKRFSSFYEEKVSAPPRKLCQDDLAEVSSKLQLPFCQKKKFRTNQSGSSSSREASLDETKSVRARPHASLSHFSAGS